MHYQLALFDFDGTLADSFPLFQRLLVEIAARYSFRTPSEQELERLRGRPTREVLSTLEVPLWKVPAIMRYGRKRMAEFRTEITLFEGIDLLFRSLTDRGVRIAIVSSNSEATVRARLGEELANRVDAFSCGSSMFGKAVRIRRLLRQLQVSAARSVLVGDEERDISAARKAGVRSLAVTWGYAAPQALSHADTVVDSMSALLESLLSSDQCRDPAAERVSEPSRGHQ